MLEAEVVMEVAREVLLYAEKARFALAGPPRFIGIPFRLGRLREIPLALVVVERQVYFTPCMSLLTRGAARKSTTPAASSVQKPNV